MDVVLEENQNLNENVKKCLNDLLSTKFPQEQPVYTVEEATKKGDNYLGVVYRIKVTLQHSARKHFSLIVKVPPQNSIRRKQFFARPCFLREALAYDEFLPLVMGFQRSKGIALNEGFHGIAECYRTSTADMDEAIFLEDLKERHFEMFNRFDAINVEYVRIVMRSYGQLHAVSFAIKDQCMDKICKFQQLQDIFEQRRQDYQLASYFEDLKKSALNTLNALADIKYRDALESFFARGTFFDLFLDLIDGRKCEPYAVVCHGDCWNNNILFKHEESKVIDACLIDWQIMRYASPLTDIMYYLFTCTTKAFRNDYYQEMLDTYYRTLSDHIKRLGSHPSTQFSRVAFNKEIQKFGAIGLLMAMIVLPITTMKGEDVPDLERLSERIEAGATTDLEGAGLLGQTNAVAYNKLMRDVIIDCINLGYI